MGVINCCKEEVKDKDLLNLNENFNQLEKEEVCKINYNAEKLIENNDFLKDNQIQENLSENDNKTELNLNLSKNNDKKTANKSILLKLIIKESKSLPINTILNINQLGLEGSLRNEKDGVVIFGKGSPLNSDIDFTLQKEEGINEKHFLIKYDENNSIFSIKNINNSGVFMKVDNKRKLKSNDVLSIGENHVLISILNTSGSFNFKSVLKIKVIYGPNLDVEE